MDDLSATLNQILSDPQSMNQIKGIMDSMGLGGNQAEAQPAPAPAPAAPAPAAPAAPAATGLAGLSALSGLGGLANGDMMAKLVQLAPIISKVQEEDDTTRLLHALKPLLSEARQKKLDEAVKIIHMLHLLPIIKETGILGSLGSLFG